MYFTNPYIRTNDSPRQNDHKLLVIGDGAVSIEPDRAVVTLGVITESKNLQQAQRENAEQTTNVINALLQQNIPRTNIKTSDYRINMQYDYKEGVQIFRGYQITNMLQVTIDAMESVGLIVDTAVEQGANTVRNIQLTVANQDRYYEEALKKAVENAQVKASIIAQELGVSISVVPFKLKEVTRREDSVPRPAVLGVSTENATTPIEPGRMEIQAQVEAEFHY
ncbi:SIMPL domain-containing protein [Ornithinibacillus salinisoli]|uniref:SIMPL domain-containing protein n=1 Tax=Ornithinibacillus salinisoli TaxID=1848459 RepID=A0ABW4VVM7_9BACI